MSDYVWVKRDELDKLISVSDDAKKYANDPGTDRSFLAAKFLESMLRTSYPNRPELWVSTAFMLADEFVKKAKESK